MTRRTTRLTAPVVTRDPHQEALGMDLFHYLCTAFECAGDVVGHYERFTMFTSMSEEWLREQYPHLLIIRVRFYVQTYHHSHDCYDHELPSLFEDEKDCFIALPDGLVGDLDDIDISQFPVVEHLQSWSGDSVQSWRVVDIQPL
jgi:hypothetical protein